MAARRFVLRPAPAVRPVAIIAVVVLAAAVLVVVGTEVDSLLIVVLAAALAVVGAALAVLTLVGRRRLTTTVDLDDDGLSIRSNGRRARASWREVNEVRAQDHHIYVGTDRDDGTTLQIICPRGSDDPEVEELTRVLARRLDADRGYRSL